MNLQKVKRPLLKLVTTIFVTILFVVPSFSQLNTDNLTKYTEQDGLPGTQVNRIITDQFGYIWVGTINGLTRFDGYTFKRFYENPNDPGSIKGLIVWSLFEDSKGRIWVGTAPGKLNVYDPITQTFKEYPFSDLFEFDVNVTRGIWQISEDKNGRMYFGMNTQYGQVLSNALLYLDEKEDKIKLFETSADQAIKNINNMIADKGGNIWINSYSGIFKITPSGKVQMVNLMNATQPLLKDEFTTSMTIDQNDNLWMITNFGRLIKMNKVTEDYQLYAPAGILQDNFFNNLTIDSEGNIWMATNHGPFKYYPKNDSVVFFKEGLQDKFGPGNEVLRTMAIDQFGLVWMGTQNVGLYKYEERTLFKSYTYKKDDPVSLLSGWADNIIELPDGKLLVSNNGLNIIDLQNNTVNTMRFEKNMPGAYAVQAISEISPGEYYLGTGEGVFQFSYPAKTFKKITIPGIEKGLWITEFYNDNRGNQWAFTTQGIFIRKSDKEAFSKLKFNLSAEDEKRLNSVTRAYESKKHGLWLLTNDILFLYNYNTGQLERKGHDKSKGDVFGTQDINSLYEDKSGIVWVGAWQGGLNRFDMATGKIKTYTINDGLPSMSIQSILEDEEHENLWLSTFEGISRFHIPSEQFYNYSIEDGIQSQLFADGSFLKTSRGQFVFGGSNGITVFDPEKVNTTSIPPKVFLTDLKLFNEPVLPGENSILKKPIYSVQEIELAHDQNNITLEFIALHYSNPAKNKYSYKLENYDNDWWESNNAHIAYYPNLSPGEYNFRVKAANNNGVWNEEGVTLKIIVHKPWWNTIFAYVIYGLILVGGVFGADRFFRHQVVVKERERARTRELAQAKEIEKAYTELKATQSQLIQSEKMASLGELTAGIAHEIQNPLNFINNFAEVNTELIDELQSELKAGKVDDAITLSNDIKENEQKIVHHGKRADGIVKGMLQHSRNSSGVKEPTDINVLADEYLRLAYHGLRAKDKSFNASMKTDFDESIGSINVVPQDIGRVILNLITNAFYAVTERKTLRQAQGDSSYEPTVSVSTKKEGGKVVISVKDNGNGIPQKVLDKIFQPFFTTKPTGQGTGLGLSLSFDIVKAHGGELNVKTNQGEGSEFVIQLPIG